MDKNEELEHLQKRKKELDTIENHLEDIRLWFEKNQNDMVSYLSDIDDELSNVISGIQDVSYSLEVEAESIKEEIEEE